MPLGLHVSIAGGLHRAIERGRTLGCEAIQLFASNPRGWKSMPVSDEEARLFREARAEEGKTELVPVVIHMPYLPNLCSESEDLFEKSCASLTENCRKAEKIGAEYVVVHMGSYGPGGPEEGLRRMALAIDRALADGSGGVMLLLENTAGMGKKEPYGFRSIGEVVRSVRDPARVGLCLDTCHAFAAGYNIVTPRGLDQVLDEIESNLGIKKLRVLHLNDSRKELGSRLDRHETIGKGHIGAKGFRLIVNHEVMRDLPGILETPRDSDEDDLANLAEMRSYYRKARRR